MPIPLKVKWIKEAGNHQPHQCITHIGGRAGQIDWEHTHPLAIEYAEKDIFHYYIDFAERNLSLEIGRTTHGEKYLKVAMVGDGLAPLLSLPRKNETAASHPVLPPPVDTNRAKLS